jgi:hypothetical protein
VEELVERCAGVDVGKSELRVCARVPGPGRTPAELVRSFGTTTRELPEDPRPITIAFGSSNNGEIAPLPA